MPARKITRSIHEGARDMARDIANTDAYLVSRRQRKKVEMLFAHLKRILKLDRLRLRGPNGARDEFHLAAAAQTFPPMRSKISSATSRISLATTGLSPLRILSAIKSGSSDAPPGPAKTSSRSSARP